MYNTGIEVTYYIAAWNEHVSYNYNILRIQFKWWVSENRPHPGSIYHAMRFSYARFKYAFRQLTVS